MLTRCAHLVYYLDRLRLLRCAYLSNTVFFLHRRAVQYPYRTPCGTWRYIIIIAEKTEKGKERKMIKLCELTGLARADLTEIISFILGIHIAGVFAGNVFFWAAKEAFRLCEKLIDLFFDRLFKHIRKRRHR